jgi:hypothetical protein
VIYLDKGGENSMKIEITEKAIKYLEKKDAKDLVIHMIANDTGGG